MNQVFNGFDSRRSPQFLARWCKRTAHCFPKAEIQVEVLIGLPVAVAHAVEHFAGNEANPIQTRTAAPGSEVLLMAYPPLKRKGQG